MFGEGKPTARREEYRDMLCVFGIVLLLYLLTKCEALSAAHDSRSYLRMIESGQYFHAHHLFYNGASALWVWLWGTILSAPVLTLVISLNSFFGALTAGLFYLLLRRRTNVSRELAAVASFLPGLSFGIWFYSVTVEVYVIALFFVLVPVYLLTEKELSRRRVLLAAMLHGIAMLFHQLHLLFIIPALIALSGWTGSRIAPGTSRSMLMLQYVVVAGAIVLIPYLVIGIFVLGMDTPESYARWILGYAGEGRYWVPLSALTPLKILIGFSRTIIGADFLFAIPETSELVNRILPGKWLADQQFVVRELPETLALVLLLCSIVIGMIILVSSARAASTLRRRFSILPPVFRLPLVVIVVYGLFFTFWDNTNLEFWIPQSVLLWLLLVPLMSMRDEQRSDGLGTRRRRIPLAVPVLAGLLFVVNGAGSIYWMMPRSNDYYTIQADSLTAIAGMEGVILLADTYMMDQYLEPEQLGRAIIVSELLQRSGGRADRAVDLAADRIETERMRGRVVAVDGQCIQPLDFVVRRGGKGYSDFVRLFHERYAASLEMRQTPIGPMYRLAASESASSSPD
jgi:hypothetical protein